MWSPDAVAMVIDALNDIGSPYLVTGSVASNAYTVPRGTIDADFVLEVRGDEILQLRERLRGQFESDEQLVFETVTGKVQHKFRHRETKFLIEIFEAKMSDPHERSRFDRRVPQQFAKRRTYYPTPEDVVVQKLRWYKQGRRSKDRSDCVNVMITQWRSLDWAYIEQWCREHGTTDLLEEFRQQAVKGLNESNST